MAKGRKARQKTANNGANLNDVLIKLIDSVYNLINSGNIVGVILLYFCVQVFYITHKLSSEALDKYLTQIISLEFFYVYPLGAVILISVTANLVQVRVYRRHIESLVQTRQELIYGLQTGDLKPLKRHMTSGIDSMEPAGDC